MKRAGRKILAVFERAIVCREIYLEAAPPERAGQRGGGKQMAARAARREQKTAPAQFRPRACKSRVIVRCRRVSAMRKPMPMPSASSEEPP